MIPARRWAGRGLAANGKRLRPSTHYIYVRPSLFEMRPSPRADKRRRGLCSVAGVEFTRRLIRMEVGRAADPAQGRGRYHRAVKHLAHCMRRLTVGWNGDPHRAQGRCGRPSRGMSREPWYLGIGPSQMALTSLLAVPAGRISPDSSIRSPRSPD